LELRSKLTDLRGSLAGNDKLDEVLQETISNTEKLDKLRTELGTRPTAEEGSNE
jgi:type VI secretion system protein ImpB